MGHGPAAPQDGEARHDLVVPAGQEPQHFFGFLGAVGLAQDGALAHHDGVGGDDDVVLFPGYRQGFQPADPGHLVKGGLAGVHGLVNVRRPDGKGNVEQSHQLPPPGRLGR